MSFYLFTSESVSEGHPDKIADQISDAILDHFLAFDPHAKVACETLVTTGQVIVAGEVKTTTYLDIQKIVRKVIEQIGYTDPELMFEAHSCGILTCIHEQSPDIRQGVERSNPEEQGAGDQGMMFGYATRETENFMPLPIDMSHKILQVLAHIRKHTDLMPYLRPDAKAQVTIQYDGRRPVGIDTIVISTQHAPFADSDEAMQSRIRQDILQHVIPRVRELYPPEIQAFFDGDIRYHINPTGRFIIGGPHGDTGLTGRKIIVDTYGGKGAHGGGAFSGKDPSKVDRSGAYATRHIAKNLVASGICDEALVQVSYAIGVARPTSIYVNTFGTAKKDLSDTEIAGLISEIFDLRPYAIEKRLRLRAPIYFDTAAYGHMGRQPQKVERSFENGSNQRISKTVETFTWEKLDYVDILRDAFRL